MQYARHTIKVKLKLHVWLQYCADLWLQLYRPFHATAQDMCRFHTEDYINFLQGVTPQSVHEYTKNLSVFNVGDDWYNMFTCVFVG